MTIKELVKMNEEVHEKLRLQIAARSQAEQQLVVSEGEITRLRTELATARNDALEEAAKVAEDFPKTYGPKPPESRKRFTFDDLSTYSSAACRMVAEDIRALKGDG